jgi:hypothetical protein
LRGLAPVSAQATTNIVPIAPFQFTTSSCAQNWALVYHCTAQFQNLGRTTATVGPANLSIAGVSVPVNSIEYFAWTASSTVAAGTLVSGQVCPIVATQAGNATGSVTLIAFPQ